VLLALLFLVSHGANGQSGPFPIQTIAGGEPNSVPLASVGLAPTALAIDPSAKSLYMVDVQHYMVYRLDLSLGTLTTVAGSGITGSPTDGVTATHSQLSYPTGVAVDTVGNVYISDPRTNRIWKVDSSSPPLIHVFAGSGTAGYAGDGNLAVAAEISAPWGVAVDQNGTVYIADSGNSVIRTVDTNGIIHTIAGTGTAGFSGDGGLATLAQLNRIRAPTEGRVSRFSPKVARGGQESELF